MLLGNRSHDAKVTCRDLDISLFQAFIKLLCDFVVGAKVRTDHPSSGQDHLTNFSQSYDVEPVASTSNA